jgi:hypothetical protein
MPDPYRLSKAETDWLRAVMDASDDPQVRAELGRQIAAAATPERRQSSNWCSPETAPDAVGANA